MPRTRHGGRRQPANPAATSGPGALSQRVDGGPGSKTQPLRVPTGQPYGARQAAIAQQQGAPLPVAGGGGGGTAPVAPAGGPPPVDVFRPTDRPGEDPATGVGDAVNPMNFDPDFQLRAIYAAYQHPDLAALLALRDNDA